MRGEYALSSQRRKPNPRGHLFQIDPRPTLLKAGSKGRPQYCGPKFEAQVTPKGTGLDWIPSPKQQQIYGTGRYSSDPFWFKMSL
jgi:hypothetical protein